ncbi:hypothetical protein DSO57_1001841 [Entomophthora muscae]|uniref:Uncharacterized protein n=1 Tax=Entomophthora muscae TaxID=34485 RepID=A0ACC2SXT6_9FUNG|nr:hypothetical protein DSO57_1001841 [Entomophthora muscae]
MMLTTGALRPLVIPFASTFSGPLPLLKQEPTSPEITSPHIEENITDPPIAPTVLNLVNGPCLVAYPMGTPDLEHVMAVVVKAAIHYVLILPLLGYFEDKSLSFAFALQNEAGSKLGNTIFQFPDPAQLTCPTHACGK